MKLNKKILSIIFLTFVCFLGINGVKADEYIGICEYITKIDNKDISFKISYKNNGTVIGANGTKNGDKDPNTGEAIWNFMYDFDENFYKSVYKTEEDAKNGKNSDCPKLNICFKKDKLFNVSIDAVHNSCASLETKYSAISNGTIKKIEGADDTDEDVKSSGSSNTSSNKTIELVKKLYNTLKILIPLLVIILSIIDFVKVLASGEDKTYKEAWSNFVKRAIIGILIFLIPTIVSLLLNLSGILGIYEIDKNNIFYIFK